MLASAAFVVLVLLAAARSGQESSVWDRPWPLLVGASVLAGTGALVLSRASTLRSDDAFCYAWASIAGLALLLATLGWIRQWPVTWTGVACGYFVLGVSGKAVAAAFGGV